MPHYRVYLLDQNGQFRGAFNFDCSDEQSAKERVRLFAGDHDVELWQLVAQFDSPRELKS